MVGSVKTFDILKKSIETFQRWFDQTENFFNGIWREREEQGGGSSPGLKIHSYDLAWPGLTSSRQWFI